MARIKITEQQLKKITFQLVESKDVKGGLNRVNNQAKSQFRTIDEDMSNVVTGSLPGVSGTQMTNKKEVPMPAHVNEDLMSPELHKAIYDLIEGIWVNNNQKGLDKFLVEHGITWGDIALYLTSVGVIGAVASGGYKVKNFFNRKFSADPHQKMQEKKEEIEKITSKIEKDPKAPWSQNKLKDPQGQQLAKVAEAKPQVDEVAPDNYYSAEPHPDSPQANRASREPTIQRSNAKPVFKPIGMGGEIAILDGPNGKYSFFFGNMRRDEFGNPDYSLTPEDVADYVNENLATISKGQGLQDFEKADLVKIDEPLKNELLNLYAKDHRLVGVLKGLSETTGAASSGAFVGPIAMSSKPEVTEEEKPEEPIEETTTAASSGAYVQPQIWAKDKKNWAGAQKTQYPGGQMVSIDKCTSYNNNKEAENGRCSQGAVDNVVKTHKTKNSVISRNIYTEIAKKTGRSVEAIQELIESKLAQNKSL